MRTLIRRRMPDGSHQQQVIESVSLTLGRDTGNSIELPGVAVAPRHAKLTMAEAGKYHIESTSLTGLEINDVAGVREQELVAGDKIAIGDHTITIDEPGFNVDLVIELALAPPQAKVKNRTGAIPTVAQPAPAAAPAPSKAAAKGPVVPARPAAAPARASPVPPKASVPTMTTLRDSGMGYRRASWLIAIVVLGVALVLPLVSRSMPELWPGLLPSDKLWSSGRMSGGHAYFGDQCATCHQDLFVRVTDSACTTCHTTTRHHSDNPAIRDMAGFAELRCASCHREHDTAALDPPHPSVCTRCHADPKFADFPDLAPAADFGTAHPAFRPTVTVRTGDSTLREERHEQTPELKDQAGLVFNHAIHLSAAGVRGPDGMKHMACGDCHVPDAARMGFRDLRFDRHCQSCHALDANLGGTLLRLPHANEAMLRELLGKYLARAPAAAAAPEPEARRRMGDSAERGSAGDLGDEVRRTTGRVCSKCHELQTAATGLPQVRPLTLRHSWLAHARFTHAEHEAMECARCHAAEASQSAEQLLLPTLRDCRTCHAGVDSTNGVSSTCIDCHRLHQARLPWADPETKGERVSERLGAEEQ